MKLNRILVFLAMATLAMQGYAKPSAEAVRLNNRGVAEMSQQFTQRAADDFTAAFKADPKLTQAAINDGIALLTLQKVEDAKVVLKQALALEPENAQAWFNLGLAQHADNEVDDALASFDHAAKADPHDADTLYFVGNCYQEKRDYEKAAATFQAVLAINPLHASAEFGLARALQRAGKTADAKSHFTRFQHLTNTKISSALGLTYGEQGHYSIVLAVQEATTVQRPMIPVHFTAVPMSAESFSAATGGACMIDATGSGQMDLVLLQSGDDALRIMHPQGGGKFSTLDTAAAGLKIAGHAVACAMGDFDGDGLNDLAVAMEDRVALFRNLDHGQFKDVTASSGLTARNRPTGITFLDYDHDGDLDLLLTGEALSAAGSANVLWRNNGNGTFTEQTAETGIGGAGRTESAILTDFNNDRAVDFVITGNSSAPTIYVNPREGEYPTQPLYQDAKLPATNGIAVLDYNKDGWMDIAVTHEGAPGVTLWQNVAAPDHLARRFERVELPLHDATRGWGVTAIDFDNDGWIDLAVLVETKAGQRVRVLRNLGDGHFADVSVALGLDKTALHHPRGLIAVDGDGAPDLMVIQENTAPCFCATLAATRITPFDSTLRD